MDKILFFVGESGCGKTYVQERLIERYPDIYTRIISTTSRDPREGEIDGESYHFVSKKYFEDNLDNNTFLQNVHYGKSWYGTKLSEYSKKQTVGIFVCTPEGISDTINALGKHKISHRFNFGIVYWMATKKLLGKHQVKQNRIDRGNITENFSYKYYNDEFDEIPLHVVTADKVNEGLVEKIHEVVW